MKDIESKVLGSFVSLKLDRAFSSSSIDFSSMFLGEYAAQVKFEMDEGAEITPARDFLDSWREEWIRLYGQAGEICKPLLDDVERVSFSGIADRIALIEPDPVIEEVRKRVQMEMDWERLMEQAK